MWTLKLRNRRIICSNADHTITWQSFNAVLLDLDLMQRKALHESLWQIFLLRKLHPFHWRLHCGLRPPNTGHRKRVDCGWWRWSTLSTLHTASFIEMWNAYYFSCLCIVCWHCDWWNIASASEASRCLALDIFRCCLLGYLNEKHLIHFLCHASLVHKFISFIRYCAVDGWNPSQANTYSFPSLGFQDPRCRTWAPVLPHADSRSSMCSSWKLSRCNDRSMASLSICLHLGVKTIQKSSTRKWNEIIGDK